MTDTGLNGKVVLVTGGAGGIGAAISRAFAAEGARVAIHYLPGQDAPPPDTEWAHRTPDAGTAARLASQLPDAIALAADLTAKNTPRWLLETVTETFGPIDVLVNNAAHAEIPDAIDSLDFDSLDRTYRVNTFAPAVLTSELARRAATDSPPCVVNISTDAARAFPGQLAYGSSKAALEAFTRGVALDLADSGIRVNAVAPGPVQTGWISEDQVPAIEEIIPMERLGTPEDIADAVVFLASHQSRWITGQVLQVAGGHAL